MSNNAARRPAFGGAVTLSAEMLIRVESSARALRSLRKQSIQAATLRTARERFATRYGMP